MKAMTLNIGKTLTLLLLLTGFSATAQKKNITVTQLPAAAQNFIKTNFAGQAVNYALEDKELLGTEYKAKLANGTEIEFDKNGNWEEIDGNKTALPASAIPAGITAYVNKTYKGQQVTQIDKSYWGYEVELTNGLELDFDAKGNFLRIDD